MNPNFRNLRATIMGLGHFGGGLAAAKWLARQGAVVTVSEAADRTAYKSKDGISEDSASEFAKMLIARQHLSVLEHVAISVRFICDRVVSHKIARHRITHDYIILSRRLSSR
jgi:thymidylate synthase ThyX